MFKLLVPVVLAFALSSCDTIAVGCTNLNVDAPGTDTNGKKVLAIVPKDQSYSAADIVSIIEVCAAEG